MTEYCIPEDSHLQQRGCESLKFHPFVPFLFITAKHTSP